MSRFLAGFITGAVVLAGVCVWLDEREARATSKVVHAMNASRRA